MAESVVEQAFQPFFTTKGVVGTGLGLWITQDIIDRHRGRIWLRTSQRKEHSGTVIAIFLPFDAVSR
jgi:signal transduction histidine kinase